jgi:hypothetical protein
VDTRVGLVILVGVIAVGAVIGRGFRQGLNGTDDASNDAMAHWLLLQQIQDTTSSVTTTNPSCGLDNSVSGSDSSNCACSPDATNSCDCPTDTSSASYDTSGTCSVDNNSFGSSN